MFIDILCELCSHIVFDEWRSYANINRIHIAIYEHSVVRNVVVVVLLSQRWTLFCCSQRRLFQQLPCMSGW